MPPPSGRRLAAPENPLRRRISLCRHSVETDDQDAATAWKEGNKMQQPRRLEGGERGVPERPNPLRRRSSLRYSERLRKYRSNRGFRFLSYVCICAKFFFPTGFFFFFLHCLVYVYNMFNVIGCLCCPYVFHVVSVVSGVTYCPTQ